MKPRIMYIEQGGGLAGAGRIGRVTFSKTGRIRNQPENAHLTSFRSLGRHAKKASRG
jgi:hypothetical protein